MSVVETKARLSSDDSVELWRAYKGSGDPRLRDRLVLTFAPMVKYIVYRKVREIPAHCEAEDFISCGLEALIRCIDRYDPDKGATLEQYAWTRIHGAVLDELRRNDWAPRSLRRWDRDINRAREQFVSLYGRQPSRGELSGSLGITVEELRERQDDIARADVGSLNSVVLADEETSVERIDTLQSSDRDTDPEHAAIRSEATQRLRAALELLPERDRKVAVMLYVHNLTLREIGEVIGVSESRVCQLNGELTKKLRTLLSADEQLLMDVA
jgi:RNA polymerase sigma factor for flagellar operon FliA